MFTVTSRQSYEVFAHIYRYGAFLLFTPAALMVLAIVVARGSWGAVALWHESGEVMAGLNGHPLTAILLIKLCFWPTVVIHMIMHPLAGVHYKRPVREFAVTMLHGFIPTFYVSVTDIFMASRRARIVNALAGPLVHLFLGSACLWAASLVGRGFVKGFLAASAIPQLLSFFVSLYPFCFLEMDGYWILAALLGMPTLNRDSVSFVRHRLWSRLRRRRSLNGQEVACVAYFALSVASIAGFIGFYAWVLIAMGSHARKG